MSYDVTVRSGWFSQEEFNQYCCSVFVDPIARLLLTSDGSVTSNLRALFLVPIELEVRDQGESEAGRDLADYLEVDPSEKVINRSVWLKTMEKRLVYASSNLPASRIDARLYRELKEKRRPIGILLGEYNIPVYKDLLAIGKVESKGVASDLGLDKETLFWARHYRLNMDGGARISITEVFSPFVFDSSIDDSSGRKIHGG